MTPEQLAGAYRLIEWVVEADDGQTWQPFGEGTKGLITYTADGRMIGMLMSDDRPLASADNMPSAPIEEQAAMAAGYLAYGGSYTLKESVVTHHVEMSLFTNWIGTDQIRHVTYTDDGDMVLSTPPSPSRSGRMLVNRLRWRRITS